MDIKIEKNIPIPKGGINGKGKFPFAEMKIGDSFALPIKEAGYVRTHLNQHKIRSNEKDCWITRTVGKEIRVWRINPKS